MAALKKKETSTSQFCGGAIYTNEWIITAAHCIPADGNPNGMHVQVGSTNLTLGEGQSVAVAQIVIHPQNNPDTNDFDIALLILVSPLIFSENVSAIQLIGYQLPAGASATVIGWGAFTPGYGVIASPTLLEADVKIVDYDSCNQTYQGGITQQMICAGNDLGIGDTCQGDSGGPMIHEGQHTGIVSFGLGCGIPLIAGVYANTFKLQDFIIEVAGHA